MRKVLSATAIVGIFVTIGLVIIYMGMRMMEKQAKGPTQTITVFFKDAGNAGHGTEVYVNGRSVGWVKEPPKYKQGFGWIYKIAIPTSIIIPVKTTFTVTSEAGGLMPGAKTYIDCRIPQIPFAHRVPSDYTATQAYKDFLASPEYKRWLLSEEGQQFKNYPEVQELAPIVNPNDYLEPAPKNHVFTGQVDEGLQGIIKKGQQTVDQVNKTIEQINNMLGSGVENRFDEMTKGIENAVLQINNILSQINSIVSSSQASILGSVKNINLITEDLRAVSSEIRKVATDPVMLKRVNTITANLETTTTSIDKILASVEELTGDPQVKQNIKDTLTNLKLTTQEAAITLQQMQSTIKKLDVALEKAPDLIDKASSTLDSAQDSIQNLGNISSFMSPHGEIRQRWYQYKVGNKRNDSFRGDFDLRLGSNNLFLLAGVDNIGEDNDVNLQAGSQIFSGVTVRPGIIRSKLGLGLDIGNPDNLQIILNGFDPNNITLNSYLKFRFNKSISLIGGVEDTFRKNKITAGIGYNF